MMYLETTWFEAAFHSTPMQDPGPEEFQRPIRIFVCRAASVLPCLLSCCCWRQRPPAVRRPRLHAAPPPGACPPELPWCRPVRRSSLPLEDEAESRSRCLGFIFCRPRGELPLVLLARHCGQHVLANHGVRLIVTAPLTHPRKGPRSLKDDIGHHGMGPALLRRLPSGAVANS